MKVEAINVAHNKSAIKKQQPSFKGGESPDGWGGGSWGSPWGNGGESNYCRSTSISAQQALRNTFEALQSRLSSLKAQQEMRANIVSPVLLRTNNNLTRVIK